MFPDYAVKILLRNCRGANCSPKLCFGNRFLKSDEETTNEKSNADFITRNALIALCFSRNQYVTTGCCRAVCGLVER